MSLKKFMPWWSKIAAKVVLSQLPVDYKVWKKLSLIQLGSMEQPTYAYEVFKRHLERVRLKPGFISLELGPGDSLFSALLSQAFGGSVSYLVDNGDYAIRDIQFYKTMATFLSKKGLRVPTLSNVQSVEEILAHCNAHYLTTGLSSLQTLPEGSVDFIWSNAVLEHVRRAEFLDLLKELRRVIRKDGVCSHEIDLRDHLGGALNNLRFSESIWESNFMAKSGFYTNRIQFFQMLELFRQARFEVEVVEVNRWSKLPTLRTNLAK
ncbi:MAG: methyltransferase domain-containing protein [Coleofasciculus sp. A1-SPW-01]|uniref:class I SAM-dependent methyltransferase n=1 Tax=Coleofasciculus sp. A1-SPW-01 TaxID=3070819 RepID=UPI003300A56C